MKLPLAAVLALTALCSQAQNTPAATNQGKHAAKPAMILAQASKPAAKSAAKPAAKPAAAKPAAPAAETDAGKAAADKAAEDKRTQEREDAARKRAELESRCVVKPVMTDAEIDLCRVAGQR